MAAYIEFEISEGAYEVSCPDAMCPSQGVISIAEITALAALSLVEKHHRYRLNRGKNRNRKTERDVFFCSVINLKN
jgi:E3 ubiquitin-protein ligase RNF144